MPATNRAARRAKPATPKAPPTRHEPKAPPMAKRVEKLEAQLDYMIWLHDELSRFVKAYIAQDVAAKMGPAVQEQLKQRVLAQMSQGMRI